MNEKQYMAKVEQLVQIFKNKPLLPADYKKGITKTTIEVPYHIDKDGVMWYVEVTFRGYKVKGRVIQRITTQQEPVSSFIAGGHNNPIIAVDTRKDIMQILYLMGTDTPYNPLGVKQGYTPIVINWEQMTFGLFVEMIVGVTNMVNSNNKQYYLNKPWFIKYFELQKRA